eukprot:jgi/Tetstr1/460940/TSEL_006092.t1
MPPRPVPEDALVDDAPGGATAASIAELEKRLTAQAEALEKRLAEQVVSKERKSPFLLSWTHSTPSSSTSTSPTSAKSPLPVWSYPQRDGDEPRLWILTDDTELEKRLTAQAEALEKRLAEQFEAATAALLARLAPPVQPPPPKGTQPAIPAGAPAPEGGEQGAQEPLHAELDALDTELEYVDFAYFGQVPPSGLEPPPCDGDEPRVWILTDDTAARDLAEQRVLTAYDKYLYLRCYAKACGQSLAVRPSLQYSVQYLGRPSRARRPRPGSGAPLDGVDGGRAPPSCRPLPGAGLPAKFWSVSPLEPSAAWSFSATPTDMLRDACLAAAAQPPPSVTWASHRLRKGAAAAASCYAAVLLLGRPRPAATLRYMCKHLAFFTGKSCLLG